MDNNFSTDNEPILEPKPELNQAQNAENEESISKEGLTFHPITERKQHSKLVNALMALLKCVGFLAVWLAIEFVLSLGAEIIALVFYPDLSVEELTDLVTGWSMNLTFIRNIVVVAAFVLIYVVMRKSFAKKIKLQAPHASSYLPTIGIGATGQFVTLFALNIIVQFLPQAWLDSFNQNNEIMESSNGVILFITTVFLAPLFEEILCRGLILNTLRNAMPKWVAIVLSAAIFGVLHGNPIQFIYATALGIILGWLYTKYDSIYVPMLCHLIFNLASMLLSYIDTESMIASVILTLVMLLSIPVFILCIIYINLKNIDKKKEPLTVSNPKAQASYQYAPKPEYNADALAKLQAEIEGEQVPNNNNGDNL